MGVEKHSYYKKIITVGKYLLAIIGVLNFSNAKAQKKLDDIIDSTIKSAGLSANDWAIGVNTASFIFD